MEWLGQFRTDIVDFFPMSDLSHVVTQRCRRCSAVHDFGSVLCCADRVHCFTMHRIGSTVFLCTAVFSTVQYIAVHCLPFWSQCWYYQAATPARFLFHCPPLAGVLEYWPLHNTPLHSTALHCIALHCTVLYCNVLYCTVLHCNVLYCTVLHCMTLHYTVLYSTPLNCTTLRAL